MEEKQKNACEAKVSYQARIKVRDQALWLEPTMEEMQIAESLEHISFKQGSELFAAVLRGLKGDGYFPDPDEPKWDIINPFKILNGKESLPWKHLNPVADSCFRCFTVCVKNEVGGYNCMEVCLSIPCP